MEQSMRDVCADFGAELREFNGGPSIAPSKAAALGTVSWAKGPGVVDVVLLPDEPM
jgi:hypothetical protein